MKGGGGGNWEFVEGKSGGKEGKGRIIGKKEEWERGEGGKQGKERER
ncbi:hypothetical protein [Streptococcus pyogenes]|nr:hypothetical protein [Streptococcus pyogenes]